MSRLYDETVDQLAAALYSLFAVELMEWSDVDEPTKQWWRKAVRKIIDAVPGIAVVNRKVGIPEVSYEGSGTILNIHTFKGYVKEVTRE